MNAKYITFTFLCLLLYSCNIGTCTWNSGYQEVTSEPREAELLGVYYLNKDSRAKFTAEGLDLTYTNLELRSNHQFVLVDGPAAIMNQHDYKQTFIKAGRWFISCEDSYGCMIELEGVCVVPLSEKGGILCIPIGIGDPDQCEGIVFEKSKKQKHS